MVAFESWESEISVLQIVRQCIPGYGTSVGERPSPLRGQIDTGEVQFATIGRA